jgi:signal transduction histidine kinase
MPPPLVTELRWPGGASIYPQRSVLPPHPSALTIAYGIASPVATDQPKIQALLEGVDSAWRPVESSPLHYLHLAGGQYRFRLRASADGLRWAEAKPLEFTVRLAWYEHLWVRIFGILGSLLLLGAVVRWRMRGLERQAERLEAKVQDRTADLGRQNRALGQAHDQIKRDMESRIRLMDMVTHDLRSPLTSLTLSVDRLKEGPDDDAERDMLHGILHRETHRMEGMVRQLLDHSRAGAFFHATDLRPCVPAEILEGIEAVLHLKAADKGLAFELESAPETTRVRVQADTNAMQQVILNLFENALKFTPGGGTVGIRSTVERGPRVWRLEVWDTGRGLSKDEAERVLQPFAQAREEDAAQGWGLGLSICLSLLELQSGELRVRSQPGQGATFIISLPLIEA